MDAIEEIKARLDIVEIISESVQLKRAGRSYTGFCPFHPNTRTPAFTVYPDTQSFYCFGCHAAGTVFDFVMRKQGLDFRESLQMLAARAGVELAPRSREEIEQDQQRTRLLALTSLAARYFNYLLLQHRGGEPGRAYLEQRGITTETAERFQLGYSLNRGDHLLAYLTSEQKGYTPDEVVAAGLAIRPSADQGRVKPYDRFRKRLIFPIRNSKGEVVGFGGRALGDAQPKYMNTPQTLLFDKGRLLYGLDLARDAIRSTDTTVVVEGYIDVITAHQHGFRNVVAPLGTALTGAHVGLLRRLAHHIYLALDADAAGQRATLRGLRAFAAEDGQPPATAPGDEDEADEAGGKRSVVTAQGLVRWERDVTLRIIRMPPGRDPDDVIRQAPEQWQELVANAQPVIEFFIDAYTADLDLTQAHDQRTALDRLLPLIRQLDSTQQRVYVARLEHLVGMRAELILDLLRSPPEPTTRHRAPPEAPPTPKHAAPADAPAVGAQDRALQTREDYLLALLLHHPSALPTIEKLLRADLQPPPQVAELLGNTLDRLLDQTPNRLLWHAWQEAGALAVPSPQQAGASELPGWVQGLDERLRAQFARLAATTIPQQQEYRYIQDAENCLRHLRLGQVRRWQLRLSQQAHAAGDDEAECNRLLGLLRDLDSYAATINPPRRNSNWEDVRDTLRRDD